MKHIVLATVVLATVFLTVFAQSAHAGCELVSGPCSTDNRGNTYTTEQNLGGGYNTYRNGSLDAQTSQTLSGGWRTRSNDGTERSYNYDPYESSSRRRY